MSKKNKYNKEGEKIGKNEIQLRGRLHETPKSILNFIIKECKYLLIQSFLF